MTGTASNTPQPEITQSEKKPFNAEMATLRLSLVIELERELRGAESVEALRFIAVNRLRELVPYHQAMLLSHVTGKRYRLDGVSNVAVIQRDAPYVAWAQAVAAQEHNGEDAREIHVIEQDSWPEYLRLQTGELAASCLLWCPLSGVDGLPLGALILVRNNPWRENEHVLLAPVLECMAHSWSIFLGKRRLSRLFFNRARFWLFGVLSLITGAMFVPVPHSSLAPSEVVAFKPDVVSAPLEGVVKQVLVEPNDPITVGQLLFEYEDTTFRHAYQVSQREVELAQVELEKVTQDAFADSRSSAEKAVMAARLAIKQAELGYAEEQYQRIRVDAQNSGIAVFNSPDDWVGRPVAIGQRIMLIANSEKVAIDAMLAVKNSIEMRPGSRVQIFLDNNPLAPLEGEVLRASYDAVQTPDGIAAFRVRVLLNNDERIPRIGARGVSKIYGESVSLFLFLFRRPLTVLRQTLGF